MANYKRRRCRLQSNKPNRGSYTSWRARHGFKPISIRKEREDMLWSTDRAAWKKLWEAPPGKSHLNMMSSYPAWWDRTFHTRPKRAATRRLEKAVLKDAIDPDDTAWPLGNHRPHSYYW